MAELPKQYAIISTMFVDWVFENHFYLHNVDANGVKIYRSENIKGNYTTETLFDMFLNVKQNG